MGLRNERQFSDERAAVVGTATDVDVAWRALSTVSEVQALSANVVTAIETSNALRIESLSAVG